MKKRICFVLILCISLFVFSPVHAQQRKSVAVVLSGGGAKGVAHIGALKVIEEAGIFHVTIHGKSAHGMMPQNGINRANYLALFLSQFDFQGNAKTY
mgnify:FL=1